VGSGLAVGEWAVVALSWDHHAVDRGPSMKFKVKVKLTGRKGSVDLMAWDSAWHMWANSDVYPFMGVTATWEWVN
jgi:hypothetical protein